MLVKSRIKNQESRIKNQESRIKNQESCEAAKRQTPNPKHFEPIEPLKHIEPQTPNTRSGIGVGFLLPLRNKLKRFRREI
jgi:hypothetical protein